MHRCARLVAHQPPDNGMHLTPLHAASSHGVCAGAAGDAGRSAARKERGMQQEGTIVEIDWTEAVGAQGSVGSPYLFGWLRAAYVRPGLISDGRVVVLAKNGQSASWDQFYGPVTLPDADTLVSVLALLGIPERGPRVEMVLDSSDTWFTSRSEERRGGKECRSRWSPYP